MDGRHKGARSLRLLLLHDVHALNQLLLVLANAAVPDGHSVVIAHPDLFRHLIDQTEIVAHENQAAVVVVDGFCQRVDTLDIQMVSRLRTEDTNDEVRHTWLK